MLDLKKKKKMNSRKFFKLKFPKDVPFDLDANYFHKFLRLIKSRNK